MNFDPSFISNLVTVGTAFAGAFSAALWLSLVFWTYRDIRSRTRDPLMHILAVLVSAILFLPGVLIYLILRPQRTIEEEYQRALEDEALLQTVENAELCPGCSRHIKENWIACPTCHTRLKKYCQECKQLLELPWDLCPYCGSPAPGMRKEREPSEEFPRSIPIQTEEEK